MDRLHVNLLCVLGALIGLSAFFLPWTSLDSDSTMLEVITELEYVEYGSGVFQSVACMAFLAGAVMAFLTQVGAYLEAAGAIAFMHAGGHLDGLLAEAGPGFYVAIASVGLIIVSQVVLLELGAPLRISLRRPPVTLRDRFYSYRPRIDRYGDVAVGLRLAGFVIAILSLQLALVQMTSANIPSYEVAVINRVTSFGFDISMVIFATEGMMNNSILLWLGAYAFIAGTALSLATPRVGLVQVLGSTLIFAGVHLGHPYGIEGYPSNVAYALADGFYWGLAAGAMTCASLAYSLLVRRMGGHTVRWTDLFMRPCA
jgi:hypothetical protein